MKTTIISAVCAACVVSGVAVAQQRLPSSLPYTPGQIPGARTPDFRPGPIACQVDPSIVSVTLTKGRNAREVSVSYEVRNMGRSAWASGHRQQGVNLTANNGNTGRSFTSYQTMTGSAASGATMLRYTSPQIANAFDDFEFGGFVDVSLSYDPDIRIDGNACNDDSNGFNNRIRIENDAILGFMRGTARTQTFYS